MSTTKSTKSIESACHKLVTNIDDILIPFLEDLNTQVHQSNSTTALHLNQQQLAILGAPLGKKVGSHLIILDSSIRTCQLLSEQIKSLSVVSDDNQTWHLLSGELSPQEVAGDVPSSLSQTIHHFLSKNAGHHYIVPAARADLVIPHQEKYQSMTKALHSSEKHHLQHLVKWLAASGYHRFEDSLEPNGFRVRGEQVDIKHQTHEGYYTVTFYGQTIETITHHVNRRSKHVSQLRLPPASFPTETTKLAENLSNLVVLRPAHLENMTGQATIIADALEPDLQFPLKPVAQQDRLQHQPCLILYENQDRVQRCLADQGIADSILCRSTASQYPLHLKGENVTLISEASLFPEAATPKPISYQQGQALVAELTEGKPAVHADHGIGIYEGLRHRTINKQTSEYLFLRYAAGDTLSVPVEYAHKVTGYLGETTPTIHRLGGTVWTKTKKQAQHDAEAFAKELLQLAAQRAASNTHQFTIDPVLEENLAREFPHELTPDQATAWKEIKQDLISKQLMDRLVVGDVGFGKTELAIRAARHVIANGKQVALLAPTTLLVQQHADTFTKRLPDLARQTAVLSRFATPTQARQARQRIAEGTAMIAIGTHALLSKKTAWHNLGLVIIDEEQRFGVAHKEHFKKIRSDLDILSLSATPIPRTLSMALASLKELSIISTAPAGRKSVESFIHENSDEILKQALARELARNGQAYVVAPKVRGLNTLAHRIAKLAPKATVAVAHGQLPSKQLAAIMQRFDQGEIDILVSSTIIANGLDLPNANTIIVTKAAHFGLSDLYQLRGRIGRRDQQGYAYFLYDQAELTAIQRQRLTALTKASRLGSGWSLAQRDLEIRGAGNLLGAEQSGTVNAVGVQLYLDLINEAASKESQTGNRRHDVDIELPIVASIPAHYIADEQTRATLYQQLSRSKKISDLEKNITNITSQYGQLPPETENLELILKLQHLAAINGITKIASQEISPPDEDPYWRLAMYGNKLPQALNKLAKLGNWQSHQESLTLDVASIDSTLLQKIIKALH